MIKAIVENASAQKGTLFLAEEESETSKLWVCAEYDYESRYHQLLNVEINTLCINLTTRSSPRTSGSEPQADRNESFNCITLLKPRICLAEWKNGPSGVINYVRRTLQPLVLTCASDDAQFGEDEYIVLKKAKSIVCMPILLKNTLKVSIYL